MNTETWIDRTGWASGLWDEEPDRAEWHDETTGLACLALRHPRSGHWCGYVAVPPGHPWHGLSYSCHVEGCEDWDCGHRLPDEATAHGGITFADACATDDRPKREQVCHVPRPGEPEDVWWLGFDCAHHRDASPGRAAADRRLAAKCRAEGDVAGAELFERCIDPDEEYRTLRYVENECADLARAIHRRG